MRNLILKRLTIMVQERLKIILTSIFQSFNLLIIPILLLFQSCTEGSKEADHIHTNDSLHHETIYYCPMDTQIVQNKPGTCPICGMDLEPKPMAHTHDSIVEKDWVYTPPNVSVLSSIKSIKPISKSVPVTIKTAGYITYDERRIYSIAAKIGGRIEKLYVKYNFQPVKTGQALFKVFSHDLQTAQQEFLFIKRNDPTNSELINAARRKLLLLGMTEAQINTISKADHVHAVTTFYSPYSGFVVEKQKQEEVINSAGTMGNGMGMVNPGTTNTPDDEITLKEGAYVNKGENVFTVANTDVVWAIFEVYADQLTKIKKGQTIHIMLENTGKMIMGKVDFIEPAYKEGSGTSKIRVYLDNKDQNLKIGNLLSGEIEAGEKKGLWTPQSAVYDLGIDKIVFVKRNGAFETRKVTVGYAAGKEIEITGGLSEEEEIAENTQFLVDSESFVKIKGLKD